MLRAPYQAGKSKDTGYLSLFIAFAFIFVLSFLSSCTTIEKRFGRVSKPDGPPPFPVDMSKVKEPVPRCEPKSRCGNQGSYVVFGKRYYIMSSSKGYSETGIASWYGMKFHKRKTSNGERFDTTEMTAAHKTLPLPSYAYVTNLDNGRRIIVRINDRGPFCDNRIIDLSYVAAVKLGVYPRGTAHVRVTAIDPVEYHNKGRRAKSQCHTQGTHTKRAHRHANAAQYKPGHYVQLGVYSQEENAAKAASKAHRLAKMNAQVVERDDEYVVQVGPFTNEAQTKQASKKLKMAGWKTPTQSTYQQ